MSVDISFSEWFRLVCEYDRLAYPRLLSVVLLLVATLLFAMRVAIVGIPLFVGLVLAFGLAFHHAWRRSCMNPPWYLAEHIREARENAKTDDH